MGQGVGFRDECLLAAQGHLKELLGHIAKYHFYKEDMVNAAIYAMALRQLSPMDSGYPHHGPLHAALSSRFGMRPRTNDFRVCDSLLKKVKDELARQGIVELSP
jgi:hypothetical protein